MVLLSHNTNKLVMKMDHNMLDNIKMLDKVKECIVIRTEMFTWDSGKKISSMVMEYICIIMDKNIKENLSKAESKEEELTIMHLEHCMTVNGKIISRMDLVFSIMTMMKNLRGIG